MSEDAQSLPAEASEEAGRLPRLEWIKINKLRHVEAGSRIEFGSNFNVVLGKNGTGKTTLLELISAIVRGDFSYFADDGFDVEYSFAHEGFVLGCRFINRIDDAKIQGPSVPEFYGELGRGETKLLEFREDDKATPSVNGMPRMVHILHIALSKGGRGGELWADLPLAFRGWEFASHLANGRLGEGVEVFEQLLEPGGVSVVRRLAFVVDSIGQSLVRSLAPNFPRSIASTIRERIGAQTSAPDALSLSRDDLQTLDTFVRLSQYEDARLTLSLIQVEKGDWFYGNPLVRLSTRGGDQIPHYQLSYGEKRLFALLTKLYACPSTIIVDELANGMHHAWIEHCVELLEDFDTQAFLSSQDPLLIDCIPLAEDTFPARNTFVLCEIAESGQIRWRNMTTDEAEDFFKSLAVGLERISEIMRSKGLW